MDIQSLFQLGLTGLFPAVIAFVLYLLQEKTPFGKLNHRIQQGIIGVVFGVCAIVATECGVPYESGSISVILNVRDAAPICAGLIFGAPAGIIAGIIGAVERALEITWGAGVYSVIACSLSTFCAGVLSGLARKRLFEDKIPSAFFGTIFGIVIEVLHMTVLVLTKLKDAENAMRVIKVATIPMILANAVSVFLGVLLVRILRRIFLHESKAESGEPYILETLESRLLIAIVVAFLLTNTLVFLLQTNTAVTNTEDQLTLQVNDIEEDIWKMLDSDLINKAQSISYEMLVHPDISLSALADQYSVTDIYLVDSNGIVFGSTVEGEENRNVGYDMRSSVQSEEFLVLLQGERSFCQEFGSIGASSDDATQDRKLVGVAASFGLVQIGLNRDAYDSLIEELIRNIGNNRRIGKSGSVILINANEHVIAGDKKNLSAKDIHTILEAAGKQTQPKVERLLTNVGNGGVYIYADRLESNTILAFLPYSEAMENRDTMVYVNSFMEVLVFACLFVLIFQIISHRVVSKIGNVNKGLRKIAGGDLEVQVSEGGSREMVMLSADINSTVGALKKQKEEAAKKIEDELLYAKKIQHSALPSVFPQRKEYSLYASMDTAKDVGGDFYDFYMLDEEHLAFLIADVSGKGIPAAMFMMTAKTLLRSIAENGLSVEKVLEEANNRLCENNEAGMFVTAWMGVLNLQTGELKYANAGHNPPLIGHANGKFLYLKGRPGLVLAGMEGVPYRLQTLQLSPGDKIFLYTDGVTEATSTEVQLYGEDRLLEFLNGHADLSPEETVRAVRSSIDEFVGEAEQFDDITMLMIHYGGNGMDTETHVYPAQVEQLDAANAVIEQMLERNDANMKAQMQIMVAFEEMFVNVCHYAYKGKDGDVTVTCSIGDGMAEITITDSGVPFNPLGRDDPDITLSAEDRNIGGLGIFMVRKTMDEVLYRYENDRNILTIKKKI